MSHKKAGVKASSNIFSALTIVGSSDAEANKSMPCFKNSISLPKLFTAWSMRFAIALISDISVKSIDTSFPQIPFTLEESTYVSIGSGKALSTRVAAGKSRW